MKKIIWTPIAIESLQQSTEFVSRIWNEKVVDDFLFKLDHRIEQIQTHPELAPTLRQSDIHQLLIHRTVSLFPLRRICNPALSALSFRMSWDCKSHEANHSYFLLRAKTNHFVSSL